MVIEGGEVERVEGETVARKVVGRNRAYISTLKFNWKTLARRCCSESEPESADFQTGHRDS